MIAIRIQPLRHGTASSAAVGPNRLDPRVTRVSCNRCTNRAPKMQHEILRSGLIRIAFQDPLRGRGVRVGRRRKECIPLKPVLLVDTLVADRRQRCRLRQLAEPTDVATKGRGLARSPRRGGRCSRPHARRRAAGGRSGAARGMKGRPQVLRHGAAHVRDSDRAAVADRGHLAIRTSRERSTSAEPLRVQMQPLNRAPIEIRDARLADRTGMYGMLEPVTVPESSSVPEASAEGQDAGNRDATRPAEASPDSGQIDQSVLVAPEFEATEGRYRAGLVRALSRLTPDAFEVNQAVEDLRALIEGAVRREVGALRKEMNVRLKAFRAKFGALEAKFDAKFDALEAKFDAKFEALEAKIEALDAKFEAKFEALQFQIKMMRWVLGIVVVMQIAMFGMMYRLVFFEDRSRTPPPPPPSPTLQAPAGTEAAPTTGTGPGQGASAIAAPDGSSGTADPATDPPTP